MKNDTGIAPPKKGDAFRCEKYGVELQVTVDCKCQDPNGVHFHCCGQEMKKK